MTGDQRSNSTASISSFDAYGGQTLWFPVVALLSFGLLFVYSASSVYAGQKYGDEFLFAKKQLLYILPGALAAIAGARIPLDKIQRWSFWLLFGAVGLTALTLTPVFGKRILGAARWISVHGLQLQP
ncbi:MAG: putative lipid flippase FtsW, partial [Pseudomonadota bacterium]